MPIYMPEARSQLLYTAARCVCSSAAGHAAIRGSRVWAREFASSPRRGHDQNAALRRKDESSGDSTARNDDETTLQSEAKDAKDVGPEQGAMSRRLSEATESALFEGGRAGRKAVEEAGFSAELKARLLEKVEASKYRAENAAAITEAGLSSNIGKGSQGIATAEAWTGTESTQDAVLRMLDDARKPLKPSLRGPAKLPVVDLRPRGQPKQRPGQRLANARDKTSIYASSKDSPMTEKEREDMKRELKERFSPHARAMPNTIQGLAALANERIEDAIARGQFKNIPRGKAVERDSRADNPFLDTTEYIMNKMIQRQDIVPPWIEKQQELVKTANVFRARLRNDWKRHAARTIASRGGSLQEQMRLADRYAEAERRENPKKGEEAQGRIITGPSTVHIVVGEAGAGQMDTTTPLGEGSITANSPESNKEEAQAASEPPIAPFRSPSWVAAEMSYLSLAVTNLNNVTRSYNLMAPELAKKPYFSVERELRASYADVAPQLATEIRERATRPTKAMVEKIGHKPGSVLERFAGETAVVHDSKKPLYGFREFWNDLFVKDKNP